MRFLSLLLVLLGSAWSTLATSGPLAYTIDVRPNDDLFHVELAVTGVKKANAVYQFAATAPGTYQVMDIGRFVRSFEAFDAAGKALPVRKEGINQWRLEQPTKTRRIRYTIAETWDTPLNEHPVYRMCGTSIEADHVLFNAHCVVGYFTGQQARPLRLQFEKPAGWQAGTALSLNNEGYYEARSFDHAVDSPVLMGRLTQARTKVGDTEVALYCYSKTDIIKADTLLGALQTMLGAAEKFLVRLPVPRYVFLYHFEDVSNGAWEHSYSSEYVHEEAPVTPEYLDEIVSIAAHEFFHIVTPLNLHSEVIEQFNFVNPTGSEHLWLYEGVTEWASDLMQVRGGLMPLPEYLNELHVKVQNDHQVDTTYSLSRLGLKSFTDEGQKQYGNIYERGAVTAALLDLRLLELSGGKRGLREVLLELTKRYGPNKPFAEKDFFAEFIRQTYPQIGDFFARYVRGAEPLPLGEYFGKVGIGYERHHFTGQLLPSLNLSLTTAPTGSITLTQVGDSARAFGVRENDLLVRIGDELVTPENLRELLAKAKKPGFGAPYVLTVRRDGKEYVIRGRVQQRKEVKDFDFYLNPAATPGQLALRAAWLRNLPML
jgi:predicted metalloprotease with PDZ domain